MAEKTVGIAFAGAGIVSEMHGRGVRANPRAKLMGVYDPKTAKAKALTKKFGGGVYRSLDQLLNDPRVQAVHVLTPLRFHIHTALACLDAGKHVLIEKPVAQEVSELRKLQTAATQAGRICMPAHNYIYAPSIRRAKRLIEAGKLGDICGFWMIFNIYHTEQMAKRYGSVLRETCVHHAYSLLHLLGRPSHVTAMVSHLHYKKLRYEDQACMMCQMPSGAIAHLWCSFAANDPTNDPWSVVYKILGTKGGVYYSWNEAQFQDDRGPAWGLPCYEDGFVGEIDHFVNRCILAGQPPLSTIQDAIDALKLIQTAERAVAKKRGALTIRY